MIFMENVFFDTWESLLRTALIALLCYLSLLFMLRIVGSRTLSQLNAFDLIVTVALGSTLATAILTKNVPLADGLLGFAMLIGLQWSISKLSIRFKAFQNVIKTEPKLLYFKGKYLEKALRQCSISKEEILQVIRATGAARLEEADAVVLETNGKFSVIKKSKEDDKSALKDVEGFAHYN
jgi:uncharacterized membrane protein YcaP (DUF421 family)